ncbi:VaFE repeat-containing surface-anchored protein [Micrococcales bacterium 31B]|nr:VaFE repeat-containing surface-anchored protein [Micrococcales bacterium 31B]
MKRSPRVLALAGAGLVLALAGTGTAIALAQTNSDAAAQASVGVVGGGASGADGSQNAAVGTYVSSFNHFYAPGDWQGVVKTYFLDTATGQAVGYPSYTRIRSSDAGLGTYNVTPYVTADLAGKRLAVNQQIFNLGDSLGGAEPVGIRAGATPVVSYDNRNTPARIVQVGQAATGSSSVTVTVPNPTGNPIVVTNPASGATISTIATDNADGDKQVVSGGQIKDVVNYTGLRVGTIYVLQTQLFDKTTGKMVDWTGAKIFAPSSPNGSETVLIPVPAGSEGHTFVVYQTIWAGADALVGKHLDKVQIRPGATPVVQENNPENPWETVVVPNPPTTGLAQCTVSGFVWKDANKNGVMDSSEEKVPGVQVTLRRLTPNLNDYPGTLVDLPAQTTDANGFYKFVVPGDQCGRFFVDFNETQFPAGWNPFGFGESDLRADQLNSGWTTPFNLAPGQNLERVDAGLRQQGNSLSGRLCSPLTAGYRVELRTTYNSVVQATTVDSQGRYLFNNVPVGTYYLYFVKEFSNHQPNFVIQSGGIIARDWTSYLDYTNTRFRSEASTGQFNLTGNTDMALGGACGQFVSPLVLDLNGNGKVDTSSVADQPAGATFDLLNTGSGVASGWAADGDGFLVKPNADGSVTSGKNLFGGALGDGYAQLASLDANGDGRVSGAELDGLQVWVDANGDHVAQAGELKSLADYGITSLNTEYVNAPVANNGNVVVEHGTASTADGGLIVVGDAYFQVGGAVDAANQSALADLAARSAATAATLSGAEQSALAAAYAAASK